MSSRLPDTSPARKRIDEIKVYVKKEWLWWRDKGYVSFGPSSTTARKNANENDVKHTSEDNKNAAAPPRKLRKRKMRARTTLQEQASRVQKVKKNVNSGASAAEDKNRTLQKKKSRPGMKMDSQGGNSKKETRKLKGRKQRSKPQKT